MFTFVVVVSWFRDIVVEGVALEVVRNIPTGDMPSSFVRGRVMVLAVQALSWSPHVCLLDIMLAGV